MRRSLQRAWVYLFARPCFSIDLETVMRCGKDVGRHERLQLRSFQALSSVHVSVRHEDNNRSSWRAVLPSSESSKVFEYVRILRGGSEDPVSISRPAAEYPAASPTVPTSTSPSTSSATTDTTVSQTSDVRPATSNGVGNVDSVSREIMDTARVLGYFGLWYALNVWYNIINKKVLNALDLPIPIAVLQLGIGSLWVTALWTVGIRKRPGKLTSSGVNRLSPVAFFHGGGQLATVLSLGAGAVSFTHVVKAMEPFFSALVAAVCFRQVFRWQVYASLVPVVAGVALACAKEINFSWLSFLAAMASNLLFACRANFSKALMTHPPTQGAAPISSANLYGLVTLTAFVIFAPVAAVAGWGKWRTAWELAMTNGYKRNTLALSVLFSGISHYLNNEVMYLALGSVHPTTLAVGNTMKRVFIIVASLIVFKTPISRLGVVGSAIAVGGVLVYSLTKQHFDALGREKKS